MDFETRKISFVQEFLRIENEQLLSDLETMLHEKKVEILEKELKPMSIKKYNEEIDKALEDSENDRGITAQSLKSKIKKWG